MLPSILRSGSSCRTSFHTAHRDHAQPHTARNALAQHIRFDDASKPKLHLFRNSLRRLYGFLDVELLDVKPAHMQIVDGEPPEMAPLDYKSANGEGADGERADRQRSDRHSACEERAGRRKSRGCGRASPDR
jgi:hypothetical protein